jgi:hypothetical protein
MSSPTPQVSFADTTNQSGAIIYFSTAPYAFTHFMQRLYNPTLPPIAPNIRVLSFHLTYDSMPASGLITWHGSKSTYIDVSSPHTHELTPRPVTSRSPPPRSTLPPHLAIATDMLHSLLEAHHSPALVPTRKWFQVIVHLVRCCENVETIEVPANWGDVRWYEGVFPAIDQASKRQLGNGRWRWGRDWRMPGVEREAYMGERSLEME